MLDLIAETEEACVAFVATIEAMIARLQALLDYMKKGATMTRIHAKDQCQQRIVLSDDNRCISCEPSRDPNAKLSLSAVKFIRIGQCTANFRKARNVAQYERLSLSLVYGNDFETLDLIAQREDDYERWVEGLQSLVVGAADRCVNRDREKEWRERGERKRREKRREKEKEERERERKRE